MSIFVRRCAAAVALLSELEDDDAGGADRAEALQGLTDEDLVHGLTGVAVMLLECLARAGQPASEVLDELRGVLAAMDDE